MKRAGILVGVVLTPLFVAVACDFPDPEIRDVDANDPAESGSESSQLPTDAQAKEDVVFVGDDGGAIIGEGGACKGDPTCDCDDDKDPKVGGACGGNDCDDLDGRRRSTQTAYVTSTPPDGATGDWNCNTTVEKFGTPNFTCANSLFQTIPCAEREGWEGDPECGQPGRYLRCRVEGSLVQTCETDGVRVEEAKVRGCR